MRFWLHLIVAVLQVLATVFFIYAYGTTGHAEYAFFTVWSSLFAGWSLSGAWSLRKG